MARLHPPSTRLAIVRRTDLAPGRPRPAPRRPGMLITPLLYQAVEDNAIFVDGTPQPVTLALDLELHLVEMPFVARSCTSATPPGRVAGPNFAHHARMVS